MHFSDSFCGISQKLLKYKKTSSHCGLPPVLPKGKSKEQLSICALLCSWKEVTAVKRCTSQALTMLSHKLLLGEEWAVKVKDSLLLPQAPRHST